MHAQVQMTPLNPEVESFVAQPRQVLIDGRWVAAKSGKTFDVFDPSTGRPIAKVAACEKADVDAAVAIGAVIKGETLHDEALMAAVPKALLDIERATHKPVGLGITGPGMTDEQAMARVGKGAEAVDVALAMHELLRGL